MKTLKKYINEVVKASANYMKKEVIRELIQSMIVARVADGTISSQEELESFHADVEMASRALKQIPYEIFQKLAQE